jgi:hypothetical protein
MQMAEMGANQPWPSLAEGGTATVGKSIGETGRAEPALCKDLAVKLIDRRTDDRPGQNFEHIAAVYAARFNRKLLSAWQDARNVGAETIP